MRAVRNKHKCNGDCDARECPEQAEIGRRDQASADADFEPIEGFCPSCGALSDRVVRELVLDCSQCMLDRFDELLNQDCQ